MATDIYIFLHNGWKLEDVQAALTVVLSFLFAGLIFVLIRAFWQQSAEKVANGENVLARSMLCLNNVGDVVDIFLLLKSKLFTAGFRGYLAQSVLLIVLTVAALFSGLIAKAFTKDGQRDIQGNIPGTQAHRDLPSIPNRDLQIGSEMNDLERANFPLDQLLDFVPQIGVNWNYSSEQWNSSWTMKCEHKPLTILENLEIRQNCSWGARSAMPVVSDMWSDPIWEYYRDDRATYGSGDPPNIWSDILWFMHGTYRGELDNATQTYRDVRIRTISMHLQGVPRADEYCDIANGTVPSAAYTETVCNLTRKTDERTGIEYGACPDKFDTQEIATSYRIHYGYLVNGEQAAKSSNFINVPAESLTRFYQAYIAIKDTDGRIGGANVTQVTNVTTTIPQLSLACLIICCIFAAIVLTGLVHYGIFLFRRRKLLTDTPQSKLDWMLWSLRNNGTASDTVGKRRFMDAPLSRRVDAEQFFLTHLSKTSTSTIDGVEVNTLYDGHSQHSQIEHHVA